MAVSTSSVRPGRLLHLNQRPLSARAVPPSFIPYRPAASTSRIQTPTISCSSAAASSAEHSDVTPSGSRAPDRTAVRLGLPSKGRMAEETLNLLKNCQLSVRQVNPRQYVADIPQIANLEVWYQRPKDIVRKLRSGDLDLGIVGFDTLSEYGEGNEDLIIVHDALDYGDCRLSIAIPMYGIFENINSIRDLAQMPQWTKEKPLRIATGFTYMGLKFMKEKGLNYVSFSTADGALEAAPAGPTISPVFHDYKHEGRISVDYYAIVICVPRKALYKSVQQLRSVRGSGVLVSPLTYIFEEETPRWRSLLLQLGL